jgi:GNAT superfamily N-acetyltransferase
MEWKKDEFLISTDKELLSLDAIHGFLSCAYWSQGRPREVVTASIENSLNFGVYHGGKQVGFARVVSDYATMFWLCDVFILKDYRGRGLGRWLMECVTTHPDLCGLLGILATRDAHGLYEQYGFKVPTDPRRFMRKERK